MEKNFRPLWRTTQKFNVRDAGENHLLFAILFFYLLVLLSIGETLGDVQRMDEQSEMIGGNFLRVRVVIDIS